MIYKGCDNLKINSANKNIHRLNPPELIFNFDKHLSWVEIQGMVIKNSAFEKKGKRNIVFCDPIFRQGVYVGIKENSSLPDKSGVQVLRGMTTELDMKGLIIPEIIPANLKIAKIVIHENHLPLGIVKGLLQILVGIFMVVYDMFFVMLRAFRSHS